MFYPKADSAKTTTSKKEEAKKRESMERGSMVHNFELSEKGVDDPVEIILNLDEDNPPKTEVHQRPITSTLFQPSAEDLALAGPSVECGNNNIQHLSCHQYMTCTQT